MSYRQRSRLLGLLALPLLVSLFQSVSTAQEFVYRPLTSPTPSVSGPLILGGGGGTVDVIQQQLIKLAGGEQARLVIIPTAGLDAEPLDDDAQALVTFWKQHSVASVDVLHTLDRAKADSVEFAKPLQNATGVWLGGGRQFRLAETYLGTRVERELRALHARGGVIGGSSAGAMFLCDPMIRRGIPEVKVDTGLALLSGAIVDTHFTSRNRLPRLQKILDQYPGLVGLGVDDQTALLVQGRTLTPIGDGNVTLAIAAGAGQAPWTKVLPPGTPFDVMMLSRAAQYRAQHVAAPPLGRPEVKRGKVLAVGGGGMPASIVRRFIEAAGGVDAPLVVITSANEPAPSAKSGESPWRAAGVKQISVFHPRTPSEANEPKFLAALREAKAVWFGGGRQWRLVDALARTEAERLIQGVLDRDGVVGGSSAGASIVSEVMLRGNPLGNLEVLVEGYDRGLNLFPGAAIDQHFAQRKRFDDMPKVKQAYPSVLGIGIDEATAILTLGSKVEVLGVNRVRIYDRLPTDDPERSAYHDLVAGAIYDTQTRVVTLPEKSAPAAGQ